MIGVWIVAAVLVSGGLARAWHQWLHARLEVRRRDAVARGELMPRPEGLTGYEAAEIGEALHRAALMRVSERVATWLISAGLPVALIGLVLMRLG